MNADRGRIGHRDDQSWVEGGERKKVVKKWQFASLLLGVLTAKS